MLRIVLKPFRYADEADLSPLAQPLKNGKNLLQGIIVFFENNGVEMIDVNIIDAEVG